MLKWLEHKLRCLILVSRSRKCASGLISAIVGCSLHTQVNQKSYCILLHTDMNSSYFEHKSRNSRVEAGSNTSTVALRVVGGDEKGSLETETEKYGHQSYRTRTRKWPLARASSNCKWQTHPLVREGAPNQQIRNCPDNDKDLVVSPRWVLYSKIDWPADRRS
jgi:hypothetical protein